MTEPMTDEQLEEIGHRFVDVNGDLGVGHLVAERDKLRAEVKEHDEHMEDLHSCWEEDVETLKAEKEHLLKQLANLRGREEAK